MTPFWRATNLHMWGVDNSFVIRCPSSHFFAGDEWEYRPAVYRHCPDTL